jgi:GGDEF domain-containing protein
MDIFIPVAIGGKTSLVLKTSFELGGIQEALKTVYIPVLITVAVIIVFSTLNALGLSRKIASPVKILNEASKRIAKGELSIHLDIKTNDEIEELTHTFNNMTKQLIRMKEIAENANPLTKLPGNTMIREQIERRITEGKKFAVIHADLDNFKVYNDCYGIGAGDVAIKMTGDLFREALRKYGGPEEFLGHEGGDDFVLLASLAHVKPITDFFLAEFDRRSRDLYSREDQERGYILGRERRLKEKGEEERPEAIVLFPLMTISLAGLSNEERPFTSYAEITNRISDVKHRAKRTKGNCFVLAK